jgi:nucleotide-binding universal stress UspA family protein
MMTHGPILVPLDGSTIAQAALPYAHTLARVEQCPIELLAVVEPLDRLPDAPILTSLVTEGLQTRLHHVAEEYRDLGLVVETAVRDGDPANTILAHAVERDVRMIVMTTRGAGTLVRPLVGSVADRVMRFALCPVVLLRPESPPADWGQPWQPRRLLVPLDGSAPAEQALWKARCWAEGLGAEVLLVRVEPQSDIRFSPARGWAQDGSVRGQQATQATAEYLAQRRQDFPTRTPVQTVVLCGDPADRLIDYARHAQVDLIVMTAHGHGEPCRVTLGSVADRLVYDGLPVCIVHPAVPATTRTAEAGDTLV